MPGVQHIDVGSELTRVEWEGTGTHELASGTSFPGSPTEQDLFYRTDEHIWYIRTNTAWVDLTGAGVSTFLGLSDTPSVYTSMAGYFLAVNSTPDALEFVASLIPPTSTADLGEQANPWRDAYFSQQIYVVADKQEWIEGDGTYIIFAAGGATRFRVASTSFHPQTDGSYELGLTGNKWERVWSNDIKLIDQGDIDKTFIDIQNTQGGAVMTQKANVLFSINDHSESAMKEAAKIIVGKDAVGVSLFDSTFIIQTSINDVLTDRINITDTNIDLTGAVYVSNGLWVYAAISAESTSPRIEFWDTDKTKPEGYFNVGPAGDIFEIRGRNAGNDAWEDIIRMNRIADGGNVLFMSSEDVALTGVTGTLIIGGDGTGQHIAIDGNEIMSKTNATTAGILYLQAEGGTTRVGSDITGTNSPLSVYTTGAVLFDDPLTGATAQSPELILRGNYWDDPSNVQQEVKLQAISSGTYPYLAISIDDAAGAPTEIIRLRNYYMGLTGNLLMSRAGVFIQLDDPTTGSTVNSGYVRWTGNYFNVSDYEVEAISQVIVGADPYLRFGVDTTGTSGSIAYSLRVYDDSVSPYSADAIDLGTTALEWANLYIGDVGKIYFGLNQDTNLYRSTANVLATDDSFLVDGGSHMLTSGLRWGASSLGIRQQDIDTAARIEISPSGTGTASNIWMYNSSDGDNTGRIHFFVAAGAAGIETATFGTGTAITNFTLEFDTLPETANTFDLGSAALEWANLYIGTGRIYLYTDQGESITSTGSQMDFYVNSVNQFRMTTAAFAPNQSSRNLGSAANEWDNLYLTTNGGLYLDSDQHERIYSDGTNILVTIGGVSELGLSASALYPTTTGGLDLGGVSNVWDNLYVNTIVGASFGATTFTGDITIAESTPALIFDDTDEVDPAGEFIMYSDGDLFRFAGRNSGDTGWDVGAQIERRADGGDWRFYMTGSFMVDDPTIGSTVNSPYFYLIGNYYDTSDHQVEARMHVYSGADPYLMFSVSDDGATPTTINVLRMYNTSLVPNTTGGVDLGTSSYQWDNVWASDRVYFTSTDDVDLAGVSGTLIVGGSGTGSHIAMDANEIQAKANATTAAQLNINILGGAINFGGSVRPIAAATHFLGDATYRWRALYVDGSADVDPVGYDFTTGGRTIKIINSGTEPYTSIGTTTANTMGIMSSGVRVIRVSTTDVGAPTHVDLGTTGYYWNDLYMNGHIYLTGTDTNEYFVSDGTKISWGIDGAAVGYLDADEITLGTVSRTINAKLHLKTASDYDSEIAWVEYQDFGANPYGFRAMYDGGNNWLRWYRLNGAGDTGTEFLRMYRSSNTMDFFCDSRFNGYMRLVPSATDHDEAGITVSGTATEALTIGDVVFLNTSKEWQRADADVETETDGMLGLATASVAASATLEILLYGFFRDNTWGYTTSQTLYVPLTNGPPSATRPSVSGDFVRVVGYAYSADEVFFNPSGTWVEVA